MALAITRKNQQGIRIRVGDETAWVYTGRGTAQFIIVASKNIEIAREEMLAKDEKGPLYKPEAYLPPRD